MFNFSEGCHQLSSTAQPHFKPSVVQYFSKFSFLLVTGNGDKTPHETNSSQLKLKFITPPETKWNVIFVNNQ